MIKADLRAELPPVFGVSDDAFVDPEGAPSAQIAQVASGCSSEALAFALPGHTNPSEHHEPSSVLPIVDGPYQVRGAITVLGDDGRGYQPRERQMLCRCGQSRNKIGPHALEAMRRQLSSELGRHGVRVITLVITSSGQLIRSMLPRDLATSCS